MALQQEEWQEGGHATAGAKHVYQREIFQLDIFNSKCFCYLFLFTVCVCCN